MKCRLEENQSSRKVWQIKTEGRAVQQNCCGVKAGRQAYVLCPLIEESEKLQLSAAEQLCSSIRKAYPDLSIGLIHGGIPVKERDQYHARISRTKDSDAWWPLLLSKWASTFQMQASWSLNMQNVLDFPSSINSGPCRTWFRTILLLFA